jgi:hypothetical protein
MEAKWKTASAPGACQILPTTTARRRNLSENDSLSTNGMMRNRGINDKATANNDATRN